MAECVILLVFAFHFSCCCYLPVLACRCGGHRGRRAGPTDRWDRLPCPNWELSGTDYDHRMTDVHRPASTHRKDPNRIRHRDRYTALEK